MTTSQYTVDATTLLSVCPDITKPNIGKNDLLPLYILDSVYSAASQLPLLQIATPT